LGRATDSERDPASGGFSRGAVEVGSDVGKRDDGDGGAVRLCGVHPDAFVPEIPTRDPVTTPIQSLKGPRDAVELDRRRVQAAGPGTAASSRSIQAQRRPPKCRWQAEDGTPITPSLTHAVHRADANAIPLQQRSAHDDACESCSVHSTSNAWTIR
jgi:hypothetical protein